MDHSTHATGGAGARGPQSKGGESLPLQPAGAHSPFPAWGRGSAWSEEVLSSPQSPPAVCPRVTCQVGAPPQLRVCPSGHRDPALAEDFVVPAAK